MTQVKVFLCVTILSILFYVTPSPCCAAEASSSAVLQAFPLFLKVQGTQRPELTRDMLSLSYEEIPGKMEITVTNWGPGGYTYSEGNLLLLGNPVALCVRFLDSIQKKEGEAKIFEGRITAVAPKFLKNEAPVLTFIVRGIKTRSWRERLTVAFGEKLLEFYPTVNLRENSSVLECTGVTIGDYELQAGVLLTINGAGQRFSGAYTVNQTIHKFDRSRGYTTRFTASSKTLLPLMSFPRDPIPTR